MKQVFGIMSAMKRKIPYGIMNWAEVVRECYFVDSTAYIRALEDVKTPVFLRPKRFGKSLWCSMLGYYYDVNCKDRFDELSAFRNEDEARRNFVGAAKRLALDGGTWRELFEQFWIHYVKARLPAQAFDQVNENFFRTTFASRTWDVLPMYYSVETEYNTPEGRCDFLAVPKPGLAKPAMLVEFKYFTGAEADRRHLLGRAEPDAETAAQAARYRASLFRRPGWNHPVEAAVVEVCGSRGYNWFDV